MTIDEAIEKLKSDAIIDSYNFQGYSMKQKEQIAEWLEELKFRRVLHLQCEKEFFAGYGKGKTEGYNKAIDDFVDVALNKLTELELKDSLATVTSCKIVLREIAQQLKAGGTNGNSTTDN